jgi:hypothetical protein
MLHGNPERGSRPQPWLEVAEFAAYRCQVRALALKPWQSPPCWLGDNRPADDGDGRGLVDAWELRRRLVASGLSMYEPDPPGALAAIEAPAPGELPPAA